MGKFNNFNDAYEFLINHPIFCGISKSNIYYTDEKNKNNLNHLINKHDKLNECISHEVIFLDKDGDELLLNSSNKQYIEKKEFWIEAGPYIPKRKTRDLFLDSQAETYEGAIISLANAVWHEYGLDVAEMFKKIQDCWG